ncbi:MAG TPA: GNAT family N-acetyltransferase [Allocoleopsis sp.]
MKLYTPMKLQVIDSENPLWIETLQQLRHDFYHLPAYLALEAQRTQSIAEAVLIQDDGNLLFLPYLLRRCGGLFPDDVQASELFDVVSPYGYPGLLYNPTKSGNTEFINTAFIRAAINQLIDNWIDRGICNAFIRLHPILNHHLEKIYSSPACQIHSETIAVDLRLPDAEIWHQTRPEHRNKINKIKRAGFTAKLVSWQEYKNDFIEIYKETMDRVGASPCYYFSSDYFSQLAEALQEQLHLGIVEFDHQIACAGLFTECGGIVQYHLGGTRQQFLHRSPTTLLFDHVRYWAKARGNQSFHLGGGVGGANDSLHHFKAGFSQKRYQFSLIRLILNETNYRHLVTLRAKQINSAPEQLLQTQFFPAYRSPSA